uniref:PRKG1_interact domain-containing protein n=1 Tax=Heterorhabditis bacteriophora TaxID=37862 RepID=A0A1I7XCL1_HETBA
MGRGNESPLREISQLHHLGVGRTQGTSSWSCLVFILFLWKLIILHIEFKSFGYLYSIQDSLSMCSKLQEADRLRSLDIMDFMETSMDIDEYMSCLKVSSNCRLSHSYYCYNNGVVMVLFQSIFRTWMYPLTPLILTITSCRRGTFSTMIELNHMTHMDTMRNFYLSILAKELQQKRAHEMEELRKENERLKTELETARMNISELKKVNIRLANSSRRCTCHK